MSNEASKEGTYAYLERDGFTSEIYKIEIKNLKRFIGVAQVKKRMKSMDLKPHKVKILNEVTFITFCNEKDRDAALEKMNGHVWKGCELIARLAKPREDPCLQKRPVPAGGDEEPPSKRQAIVEEVDELTKLRSNVTPYWDVEYDQQLKRKTRHVKTCLENLYGSLRKCNSAARHHLTTAKMDNGDHRVMACPMQDILPAPENATTAYMNKCELTIGRNVSAEIDNLIGFRLGKYKGGVTAVAAPYELDIMTPIMSRAVQSMQSFLDHLKTVDNGEICFSSFDTLTHKGFWRGLTARSSFSNQVMLIAEVHRPNVSDDQFDQLMAEMCRWFSDGPGADAGVTSLYFGCRNSEGTQMELKLVSGNPCIVEKLAELEFQVSPLAFFQINTLAAEVLLKAIDKVAELDPQKTVLLDICCGTGTLGLALASRVHSVIGIELCESAVEDANANAARNGITNAQFYAGLAEEKLALVLSRLPSGTTPVAILDPPRAGLHSAVIHLLRRCPGLDNLIYVACDPTAASSNWVDLGRQESKRFHGQPFLPVSAQPVDLFPKTPHTELILMLKRIPKCSESKSNVTSSTETASCTKSETVPLLSTETAS